jgi:putative transcriptional regulator
MTKVFIAEVKMAKPKPKSDAFEAIHSAASGLFKIGAIDQTTMREFDATCLVKPPVFTATQIKKIREAAKVSQPVFAMYLNTSESTVQKWETGAKKPRGTALKLLDVVNKRGLEVLA